MQVVDRIFLTWDSPLALAASLPAALLHWTLISPAVGTAMYISTFVAQYEGAGEPRRVGASVRQGTIFALITGVFYLAFAPFAGVIFASLGHGADVARLEAEYFSIMCLGTPAALLSHVFGAYFGGRGLTRIIMWVNIAGALFNLVLDPFLIFGWGPFPRLSIRGAALATLLAEILMTAIYVAMILRDRRRHEYSVFSKPMFDGPLFRRLLRYGLPSGMHMFTEVFSFSVFVFLIGTMGKVHLAASNLAFNLNALTFMPVFGMGMGVMTLVGNRIGEGRPDLARRTTLIAFSICGVYMLFFGLLYVLFPHWLLAMYQTPDVPDTGVSFADIQRETMILLRFVALYGLFDAMAIIFSCAIRGAGDTRFPFLFSVISSWTIMVLPTVLVVRSGSTSVMIPWLACTAYIGILGLGLFARFLQGRWQSMRVIEMAEKTL
jgi:MATE family multidrug resistance protein